MTLNEATQGIGYGEFVRAETPYPPAELTAILLPYDSAAPGFFLKTAVYVPFVPFGHELIMSPRLPITLYHSVIWPVT